MDLPQNLKDLLIREAHLKVGRDAIVPALMEQEGNLNRLQAAKPGLFASKAAREEHARKVAEVNEAMQLLKNGLAQLDRVEPHIKKMVFEAAEDHMRAANPQYLRALAVRESRADWVNCLARFGEKVHTLTKALGNVRNMVCAGYSRESQVFSQAALQAFMVAIGAGRKVEDEIKFANRISEGQEKLLKEVGFHAVALPRLKEVNYSQWVALISNMALAEAQQQFDQIINESKDLLDQGLPELKLQSDIAMSNQDSALQGYVQQFLEQARESIVDAVNPEETEASVADSEKMLLEQAKMSVHGRLETH
jgi:hypothetical protein